MKMPRRLALVLLAVALSAAAPRPAAAWGCEGHRTIALLAEQLMAPATLTQAKALLAAHPVDPGLRRFCPGTPDDPFVDASTWADDYRDVDRATAPWHFIDFPLFVDASHADYQRYCAGGDCIVGAITTQFGRLMSAKDDDRATALRFLIHLVGDIHQPLHDITNADQGGNCLPVTYEHQAPVANGHGSFHPNLHSVWDSGLIRTLMQTRHLATPEDLAGYLYARYHPTPVRPRVPTVDLVVSWSRSANGLARDVAYGALPVTVPISRRIRVEGLLGLWHEPATARAARAARTRVRAGEPARRRAAADGGRRPAGRSAGRGVREVAVGAARARDRRRGFDFAQPRPEHRRRAGGGPWRRLAAEAAGDQECVMVIEKVLACVKAPKSRMYAQYEPATTPPKLMGAFTVAENGPAEFVQPTVVLEVTVTCPRPTSTAALESGSSLVTVSVTVPSFV